MSIILALAAMAALIIVCITFVVYDQATYVGRVFETLQSQANLVSINLQAPIVFRDDRAIAETLNTLKQSREVVAACVYLPDKQIFGQYLRSDVPTPQCPPDPLEQWTGIANGRAYIVRTITHDKDSVGYLFLTFDVAPFGIRAAQFSVAASLVLIAIGATTIILALSLKRFITTPILSLVKTVQRITHERNYHVRVSKERSDEIGRLVDAFNTMLATIAERTDQLQRERESLAQKIREIEFLYNVSEVFVHSNGDLPAAAHRLAQILVRALPCGDGACRIEVGNQSWGTPGVNDRATLHRTAISAAGKDYGSIVLTCKRDAREPGCCIDTKDIQKLLSVLSERLAAAVERQSADSERSKLERELRQAQKMELLGTLAGGIAHDFNNLLTPIMGYLSMALGSAPLTEHMKSYLSEAQKGCHRAADLVRRILAFSGKHEETPELVYLNTVVRDVIKLARATLPSTVTIEGTIDKDAPPMTGVPVQLHQVFMNLVTNAFQALPGGRGKISLVLDRLQSKNESPGATPSVLSSELLRVRVTDTGTGIDEATKERIFEPFFTTKRPGEGTGLGLSVVHGIVKSHGGTVDVESTVGVGTTFTICFPEAPAESRQAKSVLAQILTPPAQGSERILVVDDEEEIVSVIERMLRVLGYRVEGTPRAAEALSRFRMDPQGFDLLITDQTMPELTGLELTERIHEIRSDLPIVLMSGYSQDVTPESAIDAGIREMLAKPIGLADLASAIRRALAKSPKA